MRISDWSSDVCSSDLQCKAERRQWPHRAGELGGCCHLGQGARIQFGNLDGFVVDDVGDVVEHKLAGQAGREQQPGKQGCEQRSEEHTSELQSLMRISYAVFCLKKNTKSKYTTDYRTHSSHII